LDVHTDRPSGSLKEFDALNHRTTVRKKKRGRSISRPSPDGNSNRPPVLCNAGEARVLPRGVLRETPKMLKLCGDSEGNLGNGHGI
jgi:hypothetical protein